MGSQYKKKVLLKRLKLSFNRVGFIISKKHFGLLSALVTEGFLRINKYIVLLALTLGVGLFLRIFEIDKSMAFIGDQGWYYLSARDLVLGKEFPLVGIASSHPWLHQGSLWTYLLALWFSLFGFDPLQGAYLTAFLDCLTIILFYCVASNMFSSRVGIMAAMIYATSPLVILLMRMPYHTSPIPLVTLFFIYFLYRWMQGNVSYFPLVIGVLGLLNNLEITTFVFEVLVRVVFLYGF